MSAGYTQECRLHTRVQAIHKSAGYTRSTQPLLTDVAAQEVWLESTTLVARGRACRELFLDHVCMILTENTIHGWHDREHAGSAPPGERAPVFLRASSLPGVMPPAPIPVSILHSDCTYYSYALF